MEPDWDNAMELIMEEELFIAFPYDDKDGVFPRRRWSGGVLHGTLTIGYGETLPHVVDPFVASGGTMTEPDARALLRERVTGFWNGTKRHFTVDLDPNQAAAVVSLAYNAGANGILKAPDLLKAINEGRFADAAELWKTSVLKSPEVEAGIRKRRAKESILFSTPHPSEAFMALSAEQQDQLLRTTMATNEAVGRLEIAVRDPNNGLQAQIDTLKAKVEQLLAQP